MCGCGLLKGVRRRESDCVDLVEEVGLVVDPLLHVGPVVHGKRAHGGLGGGGRWHVKLHLQVVLQGPGHLLVGAQLQATEEGVRVT